MVKHIIPQDWDKSLTALTPAQRLFLFYYAQVPDVGWACEQAGCAVVTVKKTWSRQPVFRQAWNMIVRGEVVDVIQAHAKDQAAKSLARILDLRDQDDNKGVALAAAQAMLRAVRDPTFASRVEVTRDIGDNWRRLLTQLMPEIKGLADGSIVDAEDWHYVDEAPLALLENSEEEEDDSD